MKRLAAVLLWIMICLFCAGAQAEEAQTGVFVDFELLSALNPDCVGWLYQPSTGLSQPVMQHETDTWYRDRAFDEIKVYKTGSVHLYAADSLQDDVVVLHGQTRSEGCLEELAGWREAEYAQNRRSFVLLTPEGDYQAEVFASVVVSMSRELADWMPPESGRRTWLAEKVLPASTIETDAACLPGEDDRILMIAGEHTNDSITLVMAALRPAEQNRETAVNLTKAAMDAKETQNGIVQVGPAGELMVYAQNDPLYHNLYYESAIRNGTQRDFGGGGCGPTAMAIIVANLVDRQELPLIGQHAKTELGNLFCSCSVNRVYCTHLHVPYQLKTPEEYLRYLPVAMADFAAGNNEWEYVGRRVDAQGTNIKFVDYVCEAYGITAEPLNGLEAALELMKEKTGKGLILTSALRGSPLTNSSHFVIIAGVDEEYFYIIDPLRRTEEEYLKTDTRKVLEYVSPGVVRIKLDDYGRSDLSPVSYFGRGE